MTRVELIPLPGVPEITPGADLAMLVVASCEHAGLELRDHDLVCIAQKAVSKAEGKLIALPPGADSAAARRRIAREEAVRVVAENREVLIVETRHGFVCANAGVDASNVPGEDVVCLLPLDPDASAARIRDGLAASLGSDLLAVVVSDSFGRPWRYGITNVAIGVAGMEPLADYRGEKDTHGHLLTASVLAVADELASAAELVMGKTAGIPVALVRNYPYKGGRGTGRDLLMEPERDLFR